MRLATITVEVGTTAAVVTDGGVVPVPGYLDTRALLRDGERGLGAARAAEAGARAEPLDRGLLRGPVLEPGAVFCVGLNFRTHIAEMGRELPEHPTIFLKLTRALTGPFEEIYVPAVSTHVDYEGELVIVVGSDARDVAEEDAAAHIAGYTIMNDVSMRDWQYRTLQWDQGKNFERSTPVGPWIVTADSFEPVSAILTVEVNGSERQRAELSDLVFGPAQLVSYISRFTTLLPGDLIATGTPGGVGHTMDPPGHLVSGDVVRVSVGGIGEIESVFR